MKLKLALYYSKMCSGCSVSEIISWKSCLDSLAPESYPGSLILGRPVMSFLIRMSLSSSLICLSLSCCPVQSFLFQLSCPSCHALNVLSKQQCPDSAVPAVLFSLSCLLALSCLFCSGYPILAEFFRLACSSCPVLTFKSISAGNCPVFWRHFCVFRPAWGLLCLL